MNDESTKLDSEYSKYKGNNLPKRKIHKYDLQEKTCDQRESITVLLPQLTTNELMKYLLEIKTTFAISPI